MSTDGPSHLVSLKVMRLSRPALASAWQPFYSSSLPFSAHSSASILSLQGSEPLPGHPKTLRDLTHTSEVLTLPSAFGSIQLGETFSGCLCVNNDTNVEVEITQFKVEMQTATTKTTLYEIDSSHQHLAGADTLEIVVHHEIKEVGQHVLACTVSYRLPPNFRAVPGSAEDSNDPDLLTFRKFYKFAVTNPLVVKTKVHVPRSPSVTYSSIEREKMFLEIHIQNVTQDTIYFERMRLECTEPWESIDINLFNNKSSENQNIFSGSLALLQPQDIRQYVYVLTSKSPDLSPYKHTPGSSIPLGRLDIFWRSSFGEPGRLLTSMLSRRVPLPPAPPPQPASALPPHLKRTITASSPSRPHSPQLSLSRPGTPPIVRPASPSTNRPHSLPHAHVPNTLPALSTPLPELEVQLIVHSVPQGTVKLQRPFMIGLAITVSSHIPLAKANPSRRRISLVIQHLRLPKASPLPPAATISSTTGSFSPRLPSSGFSTPSATPVAFNYALAHQKILAATARTNVSEQVQQGQDAISADEAQLPPPYFDSATEELKYQQTAGVTFVGPSTISLPPLDLLPLTVLGADGDSEYQSSQVQGTQEVDLPYVALQTGFHTIGGIRILVLEDQMIPLLEGADTISQKFKRAYKLREYDIIGEIGVTA